MTPTPPIDATNVARAANALAAGEPVCIFDAHDREGETDLFFLAEAVSADDVRRLRSEAGGLVFIATEPIVQRKLGLPLLEDLHERASSDSPVLGRLLPKRLPYDARSSFGITLNHRDTFTGITDEDRALTISTFGALVRALPTLDAHEARERFVHGFRSPGHVHLCHGAANGLAERRGHTELAVALAQCANLPGAVVGAEMLGHGRALSPDEARAYARDLGAPFVTGDEVLAAWNRLDVPGAPAVPA